MPLSKDIHLPYQPWTDRRVTVDGDRLRVLVVNDNDDAAVAMATYLSVDEIEARAVFRGVQAIATGRTWAPHIIFMDISMPECNGFEAARALRSDPSTGAVAIVAHTALDEAEVRRHVSGSEFDGYVHKGWPLERLVALLWRFAA
ncbi:response regulator [Paraburkholderia graminis]